jgi:hypothetical protein
MLILHKVYKSQFRKEGVGQTFWFALVFIMGRLATSKDKLESLSH